MIKPLPSAINAATPRKPGVPSTRGNNQRLAASNTAPNKMSGFSIGRFISLRINPP